MSGKRLALILALACAVGLMGATKPRYGAWQVAGNSGYGPQTHGSAIKTVIFKLDPQGTRSMKGFQHRAWDDYLALNPTIVHLPVDSLACDFIVRRTAYTGDTTHKYPGAEVDSLAQQRYLDTQQCLSTGLMPTLVTGAIVLPSHALYWLPFEQHIPANAHIVSAKAMLMTDAQYTFSSAGADTVSFAALSVAGSGMWRRSPKCAPSVFINMRTASWDNQWQPEGKGAATTANGYIASAVSDSFPWPIDWDNVTRSIDIGPRSRGLTITANVAADSSLAVDITRPVQKWANGLPNLGMAEVVYSGNSGSINLRTHNWGTAAADSGREPWFVVQYLEGSTHSDPWEGKEVAFTFCTDDGRMPYNLDMAAIFESFGLGFTAAFNHSAGGTPIKGATNYWKSWTQVLSMLNSGMEIASHSKRHLNPNGLAGYDSLVSGGEPDSLLMDINPDWIYAGLDSVSPLTAADFIANPNVAKVFALPNNNYTHRALAALDSMGYVGARTGTFGTMAKFSSGDTVGAYADGNAIVSYMRCYGVTMPYKVNRFLIPSGPTIAVGSGSGAIFGSAAAVANEAQVRRSIRLAVEDAAVRYNELLVVFCHDSLGTSTYPNDGVNRQQMWWALDELVDLGNVNVMTLGDAARYMRGYGASMAHPTPWGTDQVWEDRLGGATGPQRMLWWKSAHIQQ